MILPAQTIRQIRPITPFHERTIHHGMTYGLGPAGYDVRIAQAVTLKPGEFKLASTVEAFNIPSDIVAHVVDKSTWARRGVSAFNTLLEPGWIGTLTLELVNLSPRKVEIAKGSPIVQITFTRLEAETDQPYNGKYQNQPAWPVEAIREKPRVRAKEEPTEERRDYLEFLSKRRALTDTESEELGRLITRFG